MLKNRITYLILQLVFTVLTVKIYAQTSPVTVTTIVNYPTSIYLPDYYSSAANKLTANLILNDFNEPSRDVYLRITFESQDVKIYTKPDYYPAEPVTLYPGELVRLSGDDLEQYLNYNNAVLEGITYTEMVSRRGRLPEGFYNICLEAYDYTTKKLLSNTSCNVAHLAQFEPPRITTPEKGKVISPGTSQNITFTWINESPVDQTNISYKFTLHELIDPEAAPEQAIHNKKTVIVHEEELSTPMFNYNSSHPLLEVGKTYIYTVQAIALDGKAMFKNDGISEPSYFHYGYPGNGKIQLISPEDNEGLQLTREKTFSWSAPDNILSGQNYQFEIIIAEADSTREPKEVLEEGNLLYSYKTPTRTGSMNYFQNVTAHFPTGKKFIWQVKAYSGEQQIAKSNISMFGGPPCIVDFIAADEYVQVTFTDGCDLSNMTGKGKVSINKNGDKHKVWFNNVKLEKDGVQYYLREGEVLGKIDDLPPIKLTPEFSRNGEAWFYPDSLKITRYDYTLKGHVEWKFPHAADQQEVPVISSVPTWINFPDFLLLGPLNFPDSVGFDLLDPMNFRIEFTEGSRFYIRGDNKYFIDFIGNITLPETVKDTAEKTIVVPFSKHDQIFNIHSTTDTSYQTIHVANKTTLNLTPTEFVFDFDNDDSPEYFKAEPLWRGFYIKAGTYSFNGDYKFSKQFASFEPLKTEFNFDEVTSEYAYVLGNGLYVKSNIDFGEDNKLFFNTFPAFVNNFHIDVAASRTKEGKINGELVVPLLSNTEDFPFTCKLTQHGFMPGFLDEDIEDKTFDYNKDGGEQHLRITFNRGFFADNERIESTITIDWPYLGLKFEKIPAFRIWGNYDIGFGMPNGAFSLAQQLQTKIKGYEVTIDGIGAGRQGNLYAIGTTAKMVMAEDVSGESGPPVINLYSIAESSKIDEQYILGNSPDYKNANTVVEGEEYEVDEKIGKAIDEVAIVGDIDAIMAKFEQKAAEVNAKIEAAKPRPTVGLAPPSDNLQEDFAGFIPTQADADQLEDPVGNLTLQELMQLIDFIAPFLDKDQQEKISAFKEFVASCAPEEIASIMEKLNDIRGLLNRAIKGLINAEVAKVTKPLKDQVDELNKNIEKGIMVGSDSLVAVMDQVIDETVNVFVDGAIELLVAALVEDPSGIMDDINEVSSSVRYALKTELKRSVTKSVKENIVVPAQGFVDTILYTGTIVHLSKALSNNAANLITNSDFNLEDIDFDFDGMVDNISNQISSKVNFDYFSARIAATIDGTINTFNWDSVANLFMRDLVGVTIEEHLADIIEEGVGSLLGENVGKLAGGIASTVDMDFSNIGDKLKNGDIGDIIKFDPSHIVLVTPVVDLEGYVKMTEDDPVWGDSWQAMLMAHIKVPSPEDGFQAYAKYVNGNKPKGNTAGLSEEELKDVETFKYWFVEIGARKLNVPLAPLPIVLTGADGKLYHHMEQQSDLVTFLPSEKVRYGAGLRIYMVDEGSRGVVADFNVGLDLKLLQGGFIFEMNGTTLIANLVKTNEKGEKQIIKSFAEANGFLRYNSVENHFLGNLSATAKAAPIICAGGEMIIDISKDWWQFSVGTRKKPLGLAIFCRDTIFRGWFDVNKNGLDVGLMRNIDFDLRSGWYNIGVAKFRGWARFKYDFESELILAWNPNFKVQKARVYMDLYVGVGVDYKTPPLYMKKRTFEIAAINLGGTLDFELEPETHLYGEVHGRVTVLGVSAGVKMEADLKF